MTAQKAGRLESDRLAVRQVQLNRSRTRRGSFETGLDLLFMANVIRKSALGFDRDKGISAALKRVMARVREEGSNCLQIAAVESHSFFGIPYVSVSAHPRHIQKGMVFSPHSQPARPELGPVELRPQKIVT